MSYINRIGSNDTLRSTIWTYLAYIGISYSIDFIWGVPIVIGKPMHFGGS